MGLGWLDLQTFASKSTSMCARITSLVRSSRGAGSYIPPTNNKTISSVLFNPQSPILPPPPRNPKNKKGKKEKPQNSPAAKTCWNPPPSSLPTLSTASRMLSYEVTSTSTVVIPSRVPACLKSFSADAWLRTKARTLRPERREAMVAETPMWPVAPMIRTVSLGVGDMVGRWVCDWVV